MSRYEVDFVFKSGIRKAVRLWGVWDRIKRRWVIEPLCTRYVARTYAQHLNGTEG